MSDLPPVGAGFVRLLVHLPRNHALTPGTLAQSSGVKPELIGPIAIFGPSGYIDIIAEAGREARVNLTRIGQVQLLERNWVWLRLAIGRNHGLGMGQFRKIMVAAGAKALGRIVIQNTHTLVGLPDDLAPDVAEMLGRKKINGYSVRPTLMDPRSGPGSPEFVRGT